jgi:GNAT superfamily N-acetyltransferase
MTLFDGLYSVQKKELQNAVDVLTNAFSGDVMWQRTFNDENKTRAVMETMARFCLKYGHVRATSGNMEGVMTLSSSEKGISFTTLVLSGAILPLFLLVGEVQKALAVIGTIEEAKKSLGLGPHICLEQLGVMKTYQGKGFGGRLLRAVIEKAGNERKPVYLETQKEENVRLYEKFGFTMVKEVALPEPINLPIWLMIRNNI